MPFVLSLLYLLTAYLSPGTIFGPLASIHVELILAGVLVIISVPRLQGSLIWKAPQSLALVGLAFAVFLSILTNGWAGGAVQAFLDFIPNGFAFFLVCLHCTTKKRVQILIILLLSVCLFVIAHADYDLQHGFMDSDYLLAQLNDAGQWFYRIRGLDFINDPNDFAQLIVSVIPLVFIFWKPKKTLRTSCLSCCRCVCCCLERI